MLVISNVHDRVGQNVFSRLSTSSLYSNLFVSYKYLLVHS